MRLCPKGSRASDKSISRLKAAPFLAITLAMASMAGCHSYHIDATIVNRTGAMVRLLEVDYPSASFGADSVAAGSSLHYRIQVQGSGQLKVQYTAPDGKQPQIDGPALAEGQEGRMEIVLLPQGKVEFHPELAPRR